ncbi:VpsF family polysaccharide biosynthesis protein [Pseudoalteromonas tetraodonis]|uniref:VpsF family polysaccharide biosynthesis protein n=1 Tax=Pseudoalteromonas tetraodonis TaxID=43659 RepID=UPI001BDDF3F5|nr:VpsF family polysaccharide biosynthesis protein [Pseudoalteromonas tetraodonis]MBT2152562.1 VpsF family polysaccharide biosynthesis protein [Pseudoalteromonas tetraodonis]
MKSESIYRVMVFTFLSAFIFGGYLLENVGIKYVSEGGNPLVKIHISTYILMLTVATLTLRKGFNKPLINLKELRASWLISMLSIVLVIFYGLIRFGTSGMAYLVDTMVAPLLALYLLSQLSTTHKNKLLTLLAYLLFINSAIAILEFILGSTLISVEFSKFSHFRSTALLTHPLNNALITAALAPILMHHTRVPYPVYFTVVTLALFAFGGRAATGIFILGVFILVAPKIPAFIATGVRVSKMRFAVIQALAFFASIFTVLVITLTPIGARILSKLHIDGSAQARFDVFLILEQLSPKEWLLGASQSLLDNVRFYIGVGTIENYIIGWTVSFGVICTVLLFLSCYKLPFRLVFGKNKVMGKVTIFIFLLVSLTNNALTAKTPALLLLLSTLYIYYSTQEEKL